MSIYAWGSIVVLAVILITNIYLIREKYKNLKNKQERKIKSKSDILTYLREFTFLILTTIFSLFLALEFNKMEYKSEERENFRKYVIVSINDLESVRYHIKMLKHNLENEGDYLSLIKNGGESTLPYPHAYLNIFGNELFLKTVSRYTLSALGYNIQVINHFYDILQKDNERGDYKAMAVTLATYDNFILQAQNLIMNEVFYIHGGIESEEDLRIKSEGDLKALKENDDKKRLNEILRKMKSVEKKVKDYMPDTHSYSIFIKE